ncbi:hypothetical protein M3J09_005055 [Ascochyta lentis]
MYELVAEFTTIRSHYLCTVHHAADSLPVPTKFNLSALISSLLSAIHESSTYSAPAPSPWVARHVGSRSLERPCARLRRSSARKARISWTATSRTGERVPGCGTLRGRASSFGCRRGGEMR